MPQLLVCRVNAREVAMPIESVAEVLRMVAVAAVPHSPPWLSGMINLRGRVVPVIDLRVRLDMTAAPVNLSTTLVIVAVRNRTVGIVVDAATEVLDVPAEAIASPDPLAGEGHLLAGIARFGHRLLFILDNEQVAALPLLAGETGPMP